MHDTHLFRLQCLALLLLPATATALFAAGQNAAAVISVITNLGLVTTRLLESLAKPGSQPIPAASHHPDDPARDHVNQERN